MKKLRGPPLHVPIAHHFRRNPHQWIYWFLSLSVFCCFGFYVYQVSQPSDTITRVEAKTEIIEINEGGGPSGQIYLPGALVSSPDLKPQCLTGWLTPNDGTVLTLIRKGNGPLVASLGPSGDARTVAGVDIGEEHRSLRGPVSAIVGDHRCSGDGGVQPVRIPIFGPATIGREFSLDDTGQSTILLSGRLDTFVRAISDFLFVHWRRAEGVIIPAQSVNIPAGARLVECAPLPERVPWFGFVEAQLGSHDVADRALDINATTRARRLAMIMPGGEEAGGVTCGAGQGEGARVDVIGLSFIGRMVSDPDTAIIPVILALALTLIATLATIHGLKAPKDES